MITLALYLWQGLEVTLGARKLVHLEDVDPVADKDAPRISVIVPACNEERGIELALRSLLAQDYPCFEVIVVDDRSVDSTGAILDQMSASNPLLRVVHLRELPDGWLGKNNALQEGSRGATGSLLLFTDADIVMDPSTLRRAARYFEEHGLDHLAAAPQATVPGFWTNAFLSVFALGFSLYAKPWKVSDPKSGKHIGIGAFNLVRTSAYRAAGGHAPIAMRPDDDMRLGKLMKLRGYRQDFVFATRLISVDWYHSFREMRNGLMKNLFAGAEYSVGLVVAAVILQLTILVWPFVAVVVTRGPVQWTNALVVLSLIGLFRVNSKMVGINPWWALAIPIGTFLSVYLVLRATILTLVNGGIEWRGTRYPLSRLRANKL